VVDSHGRVQAALPLGATGTLVSALPAAASGTPFARFGRGLAFMIAILFVASAILRTRSSFATWTCSRRVEKVGQAHLILDFEIN
jgi:apolipoprotein N-acyltransferase